MNLGIVRLDLPIFGLVKANHIPCVTQHLPSISSHLRSRARQPCFAGATNASDSCQVQFPVLWLSHRQYLPVGGNQQSISSTCLSGCARQPHPGDGTVIDCLQMVRNDSTGAKASEFEHIGHSHNDVAIDHILRANNPAPAIVIDSNWDIAAANASTGLLLAIAEVEQDLASGFNLLDTLLGPGGLGDRLANSQEIRAAAWLRASRESVSNPALAKRLRDL